MSSRASGAGVTDVAAILAALHAKNAEQAAAPAAAAEGAQEEDRKVLYSQANTHEALRAPLTPVGRV